MKRRGGDRLIGGGGWDKVRKEGNKQTEQLKHGNTRLMTWPIRQGHAFFTKQTFNNHEMPFKKDF